MRREPGTSSPQGEIRDVLASSSCVISQICEYEMTLPGRGNSEPFKIQTRSKFPAAAASYSISPAAAWLSLAGLASWLSHAGLEIRNSYQALPLPPPLPSSLSPPEQTA